MTNLSKIFLIVIFSLLVSGCGAERNSVITEEEALPVTVDELPEEPTLTPSTYENSQLYLDNILSGGVPPDGIPSIDNPVFISMEEASERYSGDAPMFVTVLDGQTYLFPQSILVWHEIVNLAEHSTAVTYCPLTGSCISYRHPSEFDTTFGTSGNLLNSNLVMYDRSTGTYIPQIDGIGLDSNLEGYALDTVPTYWIDFDKALEQFDDALVLSEDTGYLRNYDRDPYGSYTGESPNNYYTSSGTIFPVMHRTEAYDLHDKQMVVGIKSGGSTAALIKDIVVESIVHPFVLSAEPMTAVYDSAIENVRIFHGHYELSGNGLKDMNGMEWTFSGQAVKGSETLTSPTHFEVMWFAWYAYYPETEVIQ